MRLCSRPPSGGRAGARPPPRCTPHRTPTATAADTAASGHRGPRTSKAGDEPPPYSENTPCSLRRLRLGSSTRRSMPCPRPREVTSTVTEHETLAARDHVSTNAPGRIEGSREHHEPPNPAHATCATATASASPCATARLVRVVRRDVLTRRATCARPTRTRQTRHSPRPPHRRGANHDLTRPVSPLGPAGRFARISTFSSNTRRLLFNKSRWVEWQDRARSAGLPRRVNRSHCPGIASRGFEARGRSFTLHHPPEREARRGGCDSVRRLEAMRMRFCSTARSEADATLFVASIRR
jgi:hypothetical protein